MRSAAIVFGITILCSRQLVAAESVAFKPEVPPQATSEAGGAPAPGPSTSPPVLSPGPTPDGHPRLSPREVIGMKIVMGGGIALAGVALALQWSVRESRANVVSQQQAVAQSAGLTTRNDLSLACLGIGTAAVVTAAAFFLWPNKSGNALMVEPTTTGASIALNGRF